MATVDAKLNPFALELQKTILQLFSTFAFIFTDASTAGLSAISGLKVISEKTAKKSANNAKPITLQELFYDRSRVTDQIFYIPDSEYDSFYDYDFTNYKGNDTRCTRGGYSYKRPAGWKRKAVRVIGKYEDDVWLGQRGWRDESCEGEWWVSYHGTKRERVPSIVAGGYDNTKSERQKYGDGIYSTPDPQVAEWYADTFKYNGETYKCILQNRVNPQKTKCIQTEFGIYFLNPNEYDIRPYGICLKKI